MCPRAACGGGQPRCASLLNRTGPLPADWRSGVWRRLPPDRFSVLTTPYPGAAEFDAEQPFRGRPHPRAGAAAPPLDGAPHRRPGPPTSAPSSSCSTRPCRSGWSARRCELPYDVVLHGAEVTVPGRLPGSRQGLARRAAQRAPHRVGRGYAAREAEHAAGRPLPITVVPPGVDVDRFRPLADDERRAARAAVRAFRRRRADRVDLPPRAAQGVRRRHPRRRPPGPSAARPGAGRRRAGRDERRLHALAAELGAPVRFLGRVAHDDLPACTAAPTSTPWCAARAGPGSSRRGSGSCSSRRRRAACRRSPASRAAPPRPWPTA